MCDKNTKRVLSISLGSQSLSGKLPSGLNSLSQLKTLSFQQNKLSGPLPTLANLTSLQEIYLDNNNFTQIPSNFFLGLTSLQTLSLSDNINLSPWTLPSDLTQSASLVTLYVSHSNVVGSIPDIFNALPNLQNLRLSYNNLTGSLPSSFAGSEIQNLWLNNQDNGLSGTIEVLGKMNQLSQVWLHKNAFTGPVPDLSNCTNLFDLQLRDNQFTGVLPASLTTLPKLVNITLQNNKLQGPVLEFGKNVDTTLGETNSFCLTTPGPCDPQVTTLLEIAGALGYPMTLAESWTGNDACKDWLFINCDTQKKNVTIVTFTNRKFSGIISPAFAKLTSLRSLFLNGNNLTGSIPSSLLSLPNLQVLDVSNNNLSGDIPAFPPTMKFSKDNNPLLGTSPSSGGGAPSDSNNPNATSPAGSSPGQKSSLSAGLVVGIILGILVFIGIIGYIIYTYARRNRKFGRVDNPENRKEVGKNGVIGVTNGYGGVPSELQSQSSGDHSDIQVFEGGNVVISIQVLRQVTNNFSEDNILGRGGFGVVYKGELQDGTKIAVKRMESAGMGSKGMNEFKAEIAVLTKVRHRHLVALLGYCINGNERLLVYEFMPQGTLAEHLFDCMDNKYPPLTWKQRVTIALDVARGVEYLHSLARESFIHRDLKPSNILLGDDMRAKVADFGLVKNSPDGKYSMETKLAGTFGYLAPEYAATGRVTAKVDVYAFGVVLMEMLTGRKALDEKLQDETSHLVTWFRRILVKNDVQKAIDQTLDPDEETYASICKVAELAGHCTAREPFQRPDMGHAVNVLGPLVEQWKPSSHEEEEESYGNNSRISLPHLIQNWQASEGTSTSNFWDTGTQSSIPGIGNTFNSSGR